MPLFVSEYPYCALYFHIHLISANFGQKKGLIKSALLNFAEIINLFLSGFALLNFLDNLIRHITWAWAVLQELHRELTTTRGHSTQ